MKKQLLLLFAFLCSIGMWAGDISKTFNLNYTATETKSADWSLTEAPITLGMSKGTAQNVPSPNKEGSLRFYAGTTLTISTTTGTLKTVEFTYTTSSYPAAFTYEGQAIETDDDSKNKTNTWTVPSGKTSVVLSATAACRFTKIVVTYSTGNSVMYNVNIANNIANGTVNSNVTSAAEGDKVTLTANPATGYKLDSWNVTNASTNNAITVTNNQFTMPAANVNVSATFAKIQTYYINCDDPVNGTYTVQVGSEDVETVTEEDIFEAQEGATITLTSTANTGYKLHSTPFVVTAADETNVSVSKSGTSYTFTMPAQEVTIKAQYTKTYTITAGACENGSITKIADKDDNEITETSVGSKVVITASADEGYKLASLYYVKEGEDTKNTITDGAFSMVASNITVYATFEEKGDPLAGLVPLYTLQFKSNTSDADASSLYGTTVSDVFATGADYVKYVNRSSVYAAKSSYNGAAKFGTGKNNGSITITLKEAISPAAVVVTACRYGESEAGTLTINGTEYSTDETERGTFSPFVYEYDPVGSINSITIGSKGSADNTRRSYVQSITFYAKPKTFDLNIPAGGWASMAVDFNAEVPEGASAYYASAKDINGTEGTITLKRIKAGEVIPAGEGVVVKGTDKVTFVESNEAPVEITNIFSGTATATATVEANAAWVLNAASSTPDAPYFSVFTGTTIPMNKAYIAPEAVAGAKTLSFSVEDNTVTAINAVENANNSGVAYNLAGQRVAANAKGIVIINGKKFINK